MSTAETWVGGRDVMWVVFGRALTELSYVVVPEELSRASDYDGPTAVRSRRPSWWDRYFGTF